MGRVAGPSHFQELYNTELQTWVKSSAHNFPGPKVSAITVRITTNNVTINSWLAVKSHVMWYPGLVEKTDGNWFLLKFMHRISNLFYWPPKEDRKTLHIDDVLCPLKPPTKVSSVLFKFNESQIADELCQTDLE